ncbi:hypothetical protein SUGI_0076060 [Cryptomeria japonica]|nr:hypothetical protein SUGI_0076060 [Cryptomeria japonica]
MNRGALPCLLQQLTLRHDSLLSEFRCIELHEVEFPDEIVWIREAFRTFYFVLQRITKIIENERKSKEMVEALLTVIISAFHVDDGLFCGVCREDFTMGEEVCEIPCRIRHVFHSECIRPWLERHNTCPLCTTQFSMEKE